MYRTLRQHVPLRHYLRAASIVAALLLLLGACTTPTRTLTLSPASVQALAGDEIALTAELTPADPEATYTWSAAHGSFDGSGATVSYTVPDTIGTYSVSVTVSGEPPLVAHATVQVVPTPPTLTLATTGAAPRIATGTSLELVASSAPYSGELVWDLSGGELADDGMNAVYTAPDAPGTYTVGVAYVGFPQTRAEVAVEVPGGLTEGFTIIVIPDTQTMSRWSASAHRMLGIAQWIVNAREARNIAFVTQVGDVVWDASRPQEWNRIMPGFDLIDGVVPYSVTVGDHEYDAEAQKDGDVSEYLSRLGPQRFDSFTWYRGSHPNGLNHYQVFEAGGREFLHLNLEWEPLGPVDDVSTPLGWAKSLLEANPDLPTIISTHAYLWDMPGQEGHFPDSAREGYRVEGEPATHFTTSGVGIFEALVEPHPQVMMVLNGHYHKSASESDRRGEYHQVSENAAGGDVFEMLANYQWIGNQAGVGGDDWIRIITFEPGFGEESDRISVETFSPERFKNDEPAFKTGPWSEFGFDLDFAQRFALR